VQKGTHKTPHTHTHTYTHTLAIAHHSRHIRTQRHTLSAPSHSDTHALKHTLTKTHTHSLAHTHTHTLTHRSSLGLSWSGEGRMMVPAIDPCALHSHIDSRRPPCGAWCVCVCVSVCVYVCMCICGCQDTKHKRSLAHTPAHHTYTHSPVSHRRAIWIGSASPYCSCCSLC
jgi:hypothetical protein